MLTDQETLIVSDNEEEDARESLTEEDGRNSEVCFEMFHY
jgi:hypothetical protein